MASALPDGDPAPPDGALPPSAVGGAADRRFGVYVHVPFCAVRCGYCDFNTYTAAELGGRRGPGPVRRRPPPQELDLAATVLARAGLPSRAVSTVFVGGGTPTLLPATDLARCFAASARCSGLAPERRGHDRGQPRLGDVGEPRRARRAAGSPGCRSACSPRCPTSWRTLDRTHDPARVPTRRRLGPGRRAGGQPRPDLRHAGGVARRLADARSTRRSPASPTTSPRTRWSSRTARGSRPGSAAASCRPRTTTISADKYELADDLLAGAGLRAGTR